VTGTHPYLIDHIIELSEILVDALMKVRQRLSSVIVVRNVSL
jgi:hypothetical protein